MWGCNLVARPRAAVPGVSLHIILPAELHARLELDLYSPAEQRIPFNSKGKLIARLLRDYYERKDSHEV